MTHRRLHGALLALIIGIGLPAGAAAPPARTIAIMPAQFFAADAKSAARVTESLVETFRSHGYSVIPMERSRATYAAMKLEPDRHYGDAVALQFGKRLEADLVAYPSLLALGVPATGSKTAPPDATSLSATVDLRVLNTNNGKSIYTRQIRHHFDVAPTEGERVSLPPAEATAAASEVTRNYFERVAGSRQELGRPPGK
jgi:hypothetical protein